MAAKFSSAEDICEGENCEAITDVTYYVKEKKKLCISCASTEGCIGKARQGGPNLYCVKHDEEIKLYCETHGVALCYSCAHIDHHAQTCVRQDIEGAIMESRASLNILKEKAKDKLKLCRVYGDQIRQCRKDTDTHLQALKDEVDLVTNEAIETDKDREKEDAAKINEDIDEKNQKLQEEIQKINDKIGKNDEEREKQLELNRKNAEKRREPIDKKQHSLQTDIQSITEEKEKRIVEFEKTWQDDTKTTETTIQTLDRVLEDDQNVVKDGHHVKTSVSDELKKPLNEGDVKLITGTISGVRQWKHINDVTIPRNTTCDITGVNVAVDQDGMIIAAESRQSKIYVINPADGKIMNTITCQQNTRMHGVLSSGHIIAYPSLLDHRVFIIDRQGAQREIPHSDVILKVCIDPMTDDLYVVTSDDEYKTCVIDQVMSGGDMKKRRVASFPLSTELDSLDDRKSRLIGSRVMMTSSGNMIACDEEKILVFKKLLSL
eukprot:XP_011667365.1 PREDICTED: uncharacterized protein LOC105439727 [Strongylocentrotus purpuratus]